MGKKVRIFVFFIFFSTLLVFFSCGSRPEPAREPVGETEDTQASAEQQTITQPAGSLAEEIRTLTESGVLSSMLQALELIRTRDLSGVDFGRMMAGINTLLIRLVYPDSPARLPAIDLPLTANYTRIIREAERGNYVRPSPNSNDFFEHILPFLVVNENTPPDVMAEILKDIEKAEALRLNSVLPPYFRGLIHERAGQFVQAEAAYRQAFGISQECYPAQIGMARVRRLTGAPREASEILSELVVSYPDSIQVKRERAITFFENKDWSRALPAVDEILLSDPRDGELLLIRASILIEQGQYSQANASLDSYAPINP
ncbi:MAG: tetratricopeptide repeat protein, partial [Treponema sp.]|nr:tetratricopeptide repeat protein [Treponema sp.]